MARLAVSDIKRTGAWVRDWAVDHPQPAVHTLHGPLGIDHIQAPQRGLARLTEGVHRTDQKAAVRECGAVVEPQMGVLLVNAAQVLALPRSRIEQDHFFLEGQHQATIAVEGHGADRGRHFKLAVLPVACVCLVNDACPAIEPPQRRGFGVPQRALAQRRFVLTETLDFSRLEPLRRRGGIG